MGIEQVVALLVIGLGAGVIAGVRQRRAKTRRDDAIETERLEPPKNVGDAYDQVANSVNFRNYKG
jgi:hypothetical protein